MNASAFTYKHSNNKVVKHSVKCTSTPTDRSTMQLSQHLNISNQTTGNKSKDLPRFDAFFKTPGGNAHGHLESNERTPLLVVCGTFSIHARLLN